MKDEERTAVYTERQKQAIRRERVRIKIIHTRPGETLCLQAAECTILRDWLKELEAFKKATIQKEKGEAN